MIIDVDITIDEDNNTLTCSDNINPNEEVSIFINGLLFYTSEDIEDITDNVITLSEDLYGGINYDSDTILVIYDLD